LIQNFLEGHSRPFIALACTLTDGKIFKEAA
jgi:hypothetical protein